jgi:hypothetical protein
MFPDSLFVQVLGTDYSTAGQIRHIQSFQVVNVPAQLLVLS